MTRKEYDRLWRLRIMLEPPSIAMLRALVETLVREALAAKAAEEWKPLLDDE